MIIASIIFGILISLFILAVYKSSLRDYEQEEEEKRDAYYDKILKV